MERGRDFLRAQLNNAVHQHRTLLENLEDREKQTDDPRYRALSARYLPGLREHVHALEEYRDHLGEGGGRMKEALGSVLGKARDAVEGMRESDFLRVVGDSVTTRQAQDTCGTFGVVGDQIGEPRLSQIGRNGEREHEQMARDFNQLAQSLFIEHVQEGERERPAAD